MPGTLRSAAVLTALTLGPVAQAQNIFTWTDDAGVPHFTDDRKQVPEDIVAAAWTGGDALGVVAEVRGDGGVSNAPEAPWRVAQAESERASRRQVEEQWRARFISARWMVKYLQASIEADRQLISEPGRLGPWYNCGNGLVHVAAAGLACAPARSPTYDDAQWRITSYTAWLELAREDLARLERYAAELGIPLEWRVDMPAFR